MKTFLLLLISMFALGTVANASKLITIPIKNIEKDFNNNSNRAWSTYKGKYFVSKFKIYNIRRGQGFSSSFANAIKKDGFPVKAFSYLDKGLEGRQKKWVFTLEKYSVNGELKYRIVILSAIQVFEKKRTTFDSFLFRDIKDINRIIAYSKKNSSPITNFTGFLTLKNLQFIPDSTDKDGRKINSHYTIFIEELKTNAVIEDVQHYLTYDPKRRARPIFVKATVIIHDRNQEINPWLKIKAVVVTES